jgi:hypothetical protein
MTDLEPLNTLLIEPKLDYKTSVGSMEKPMVRLCEQLKPRFEAGTYSLIIGDDTSGRLPTLGIRGFSRHISSKIGSSNLPVVFLQASRRLAASAVELQIDKRVMPYLKPAEDKGRVLIVTDFIQHGATMRRLGELLLSRGVDFDIAVMRCARTPQADALQGDLPQGTEVFVGEEVDWNEPEISSRPDMTGLKRAMLEDGSVHVVRAMGKVNNPLIVDLARKDVDILVDRLISRCG